jgi:hypothetical protein
LRLYIRFLHPNADLYHLDIGLHRTDVCPLRLHADPGHLKGCRLFLRLLMANDLLLLKLLPAGSGDLCQFQVGLRLLETRLHLLPIGPYLLAWPDCSAVVDH